jgi:sec-independent protein translocase protein TatB
MFEIGWTEMLVIAIVMIVVVGPKDLPNMLRTLGRTTAKLRAMAGDFQKQFNDALKEAELDDVKKSVDALRGLNPTAEIKKQLNPFEKAAADVRAGLDNAMKPKPAADPSTPAASEATAAEPLKNGATEMPGAETPAASASQSTPAFPAMTDASVVADAAPAAAPVKTSATKKTPKPTASQAAKPVAAKPVVAKPVAAKPVSEKSTPVKAAATTIAPAKSAPAKPAPAKPAPVKASSAKAVAKPEPAPTKKPATAKKKTAGTAK